MHFCRFFMLVSQIFWYIAGISSLSCKRFIAFVTRVISFYSSKNVATLVMFLFFLPWSVSHAVLSRSWWECVRVKHVFALCAKTQRPSEEVFHAAIFLVPTLSLWKSYYQNQLLRPLWILQVPLILIRFLFRNGFWGASLPWAQLPAPHTNLCWCML